MRPDDLHHSRTRTRASAVMFAVGVFHLLLLALLGGVAVLLLFSAQQLISGDRFNPKSVWKLGLLGWMLWQAFSVRVPLTESRRLINLRNYPRLAEALQDAALRVGADVPAAIRLTMASRCYAQEEGGILAGLFGTRRLLVIGAAAMPYFTEVEFRALLARALARWSKHETWYGVQARRVDMASTFLIDWLGTAKLKWINPLYWLFVGFRAAFGKVLGAYLQERDLWADQMSAQAYPAADAESAIKKQALYDAFWFEELYEEFTSGRTRSMDQGWEIMIDAAETYDDWEHLWEKHLTQPLEETDLPLRTRLQALAATEEMPVPARLAMSPATVILSGD